MPVYRGWNAKIYIDGVEVGYLQEVSLTIDESLEPYYPAMQRTVDRFIPGPLKIEGRFSRGWVNNDYLKLVSSTGTLTEFDLIVKIDSGPVIYVYNCVLKKGNISIPQAGFLIEDYEFVAKSVYIP